MTCGTASALQKWTKKWRKKRGRKYYQALPAYQLTIIKNLYQVGHTQWLVVAQSEAVLLAISTTVLQSPDGLGATQPSQI